MHRASVLLPLAEGRKQGRKAQYLCLLCVCVVEVSIGKMDVSISNMLDFSSLIPVTGLL